MGANAAAGHFAFGTLTPLVDFVTNFDRMLAS